MARQADTVDAAPLTRQTDAGSLRLRKTGSLLFLGTILAIILAACGGATSSAEVAADFPITIYTGAAKVGGEEINFSDLRGKPVVLNFWAGLCPPCRAEMPDLQEFYEEFKDDVTLIGVDVGQFTGLGNQDDATGLLDSLGITYPTGFATDGTVMQDYRVLSMPTTVFIGSDGAVFRKWSGALNSDVLADITKELLSEERG